MTSNASLFNDMRDRGFVVLPSNEEAKHTQRGSTYDVLGCATIQTKQPLNDMDEVVLYRCQKTGRLWARRREEFFDGRFEITSRNVKVYD
jgi:hypothetical protein